MRKVILTKGKDCKKFEIPTEKDWKLLAEHVVAKLRPGDVVALSGPLGAGKTTFVKALVKVLSPKSVVLSPTFALLKTYKVSTRGKLKRLLHVDAYRIDDERDLLPLDLNEELAQGDAVLVVEWADKIKNWLANKQLYWIDIAS